MSEYFENVRGFRTNILDVLSLAESLIVVLLDIGCLRVYFVDICGVLQSFCPDFVRRVTANYIGRLSEFQGENPLFYSDFSLCSISISFGRFTVKYADIFHMNLCD
jgi:hypothetical protein